MGRPGADIPAGCAIGASRGSACAAVFVQIPARSGDRHRRREIDELGVLVVVAPRGPQRPRFMSPTVRSSAVFEVHKRLASGRYDLGSANGELNRPDAVETLGCPEFRGVARLDFTRLSLTGRGRNSNAGGIVRIAVGGVHGRHRVALAEREPTTTMPRTTGHAPT